MPSNSGSNSNHPIVDTTRPHPLSSPSPRDKPGSYTKATALKSRSKKDYSEESQGFGGKGSRPGLVRPEDPQDTTPREGGVSGIKGG